MIAHFIKYGQQFLNKSAFDYVPDLSKVSKEQLNEINNESLYKYFELNENEIEELQQLSKN